MNKQPTTLDEFYAALNKALPEGFQVDYDSYGQLIVYTNLKVEGTKIVEMTDEDFA